MTSKEALETIKEIQLDEYKGYKTVDFLYKKEIEILEKALERGEKLEELVELYLKYLNVTQGWYETTDSGNVKEELIIEIAKLEREI